jgi:hypothetical protein
MVAEPAHRSRLAAETIEARGVEAFRLHDRDCDRAIEARVVGAIHALARALTEEFVDLVPAAAERLWAIGIGAGRRSRRRL